MRATLALMFPLLVVALSNCSDKTEATKSAQLERRIAALERSVAELRKIPGTPEAVANVDVALPSVVRRSDSDAVERAAHFTAAIEDLRMKECTTVRCRIEYNVRIRNDAAELRGFSGWVDFKDRKGYVVARNDISVLTPYPVAPYSAETYVSFIYLSPEHARLLKTAELSLVPQTLQPGTPRYGRTLEWKGVWPN